MPKIQILPDNLTNLIAAGEVVERPASVVKELVENALDAGARRLEVRLREGGKRLVQVIDDGQGMSAEDLVLSVQRFATSKIAVSEDLEAIGTLGFRGEALPSIAAVTRLKIVTRPPEQAVGSAILVEGGEITALEETGCAPGTTVTVSDLFYNTPARRKFLASSATERGHCADWVIRLALAYPEISFRLLNNDAQILATRGSGELAEVLTAAFGNEVARNLLPLELSAGTLRLHGLVSSPHLLRATRRHQFFFVNHRYVRSRSLSHALTSAYGMLLPAGKQPLSVLHIEIEPTQVDPNVHPTKIEVRFKRPGEVHALAEQAIAEALARAGYRSLDQQYRRRAASASQPDLLPAGRLEPAGLERRGQIQRLRVNPFFDEVDERDAGVGVHELEAPSSTPPGAETKPPPALPDAGEVTVLGQLWARYIVVCSGEELMLIDQHRAAERVLFEKLPQTQEPAPSQLLALPQTLELPGPEYAALAQQLEALAQLGYQLEEFGGSSFLVRAVPAATAQRDPVATLLALAAELAETGLPGEFDQAQKALRASVSCHAAIKARQRLTTPEIQELVRELLNTEAPAVCPHGDPIILSFPVEQLDRRFKR